MEVYIHRRESEERTGSGFLSGREREREREGRWNKRRKGSLRAKGRL